MKLAQALIERADLQKRIAQMKGRLQLNAKVQEGEKPSEEPEKLLKELDALTGELETLIARINRTNTSALDGGETMTALLARRDCLRMKTDILRSFLEEAGSLVLRGTKSEVVVRSTVDVAALQKRVDGLSKELRALDVRIQAANWATELI